MALCAALVVTMVMVMVTVMVTVMVQAVEQPQCRDAARCQRGGFGQNEYTYTVDGLHLFIEFTDGGYFVLQCPENLTLDNEALPSFESQLRVNKVWLKDCPAPRGTYVGVLRALNVHVVDKLKLRGAGRLRAAQLAGLALPELDVEDAALDDDALDELPLASLALDGVRLTRALLRRLPASLTSLRLVRTSAAPDAAALARLPRLQELVLRDERRVALAPAGALRGLALEAPAVSVGAALLPTLRRLALFGWEEEQPAAWRECGALQRLELRFARAAWLPAGWVRACAALRVLQLSDAPALSSLAPAALAGVRELQELRLSRCALRSLPRGLLDDARELRVLDLSENHLHELPSGLFAAIKSLERLQLSSNEFNSSVLRSLTAVTSLSHLSLAHNTRLRADCGPPNSVVRGTSPLQYLTNLTELSFRNTSVEVICRDWTENMPRLTRLDLAYTAITTLTYGDMQFGEGAELGVELSGCNISSVYYSRDDYLRAVSPRRAPSRAQLRGVRPLRCDCRHYWAALALRTRTHAALDARCAHSARLLREEPLDELLCWAPCWAPRCVCAHRPHWVEGGAATLLRANCTGAGLTTVSEAWGNVTSQGALYWDLRLAHNNITRLDDYHLPHNLTALDVSYNQVSEVSLSAARALRAADSRVWAAHNELPCAACGAAPALAALRPRVQDAALPSCAGGAALEAAALEPCAPRAALLPALLGGALLLAALLTLALLALPGVRRRLKAALRARRARADEHEYLFDVFVSYSHHDKAVVDELVGGLEGGAAPYRVCVHYRDWAPGGWIPAQIAASVRAARRTLCVVSPHFVRSSWARAELREALALALRGEPRLLAVLLAPPPLLPHDRDLHHYLQHNTYVLWGDPYFWPKLRRALPRGKLRPLNPEAPLAAPEASPAAAEASPAAPEASPAAPEAPPAAPEAPPAAPEAPPAAPEASPAASEAPPAAPEAPPAAPEAPPAAPEASPAAPEASPAAPETPAAPGATSTSPAA